MDIIKKYFPDLSDAQFMQFERLGKLYAYWNERINVISRKDFDHLYERHIIHSLAIAKIIQFAPATRILDVGTGGGFPGIPLAIIFPMVDFYLIDSIAKKIKVVEAITKGVGLRNVRSEQIRVQQVNESFDFIVSRAVTNLPDFINWTKNKTSKKSFNQLKNGILYLKGGEFDDELHHLKHKTKCFEISSFFQEEFFKTKKIVHIYS